MKGKDFEFFTAKNYVWMLYLLQFEACQTYHFQVTGQHIRIISKENV